MHASTVGLIALVPGLASAGRVRSTLDVLYRHAEAVVVGVVQGVVIVGGHRYADIEVEQVVKGEAQPLVHVIAESTWRCDVSHTVEPGMRVMLFLGKRDARSAPAHGAMPKGRGYFPFMGRERVRVVDSDPTISPALADEVKRRDVQVVLTTEVFVRYLATVD